MHPIYFGDSESPLFGIYYFPQAGAPRDEGVVLCYPFGQEYLWMHRAYRQLSVLFAKNGFHVLRFDYHGCGDSSGEIEEVDFADWQQDLGLAIDEIKDTGGPRRVSLVGLRMGATLAATVGATREDVDKLILWDPVINGNSYLTALSEMHRDWMENNLPDWETRLVHGRGSGNGVETAETEVIGFPVTRKLRESLAGVDLLSARKPNVSAVTLIDSQPTPGIEALGAHFRSQGLSVAVQELTGSNAWRDSGGSDALSVPDRLLQSIVSAVSGEVV